MAMPLKRVRSAFRHNQLVLQKKGYATEPPSGKASRASETRYSSLAREIFPDATVQITLVLMRRRSAALVVNPTMARSRDPP
jgi:hypothetical protein